MLRLRVREFSLRRSCNVKCHQRASALILLSSVALGCHSDPGTSVTMASGRPTASAVPQLAAGTLSSSAPAVPNEGKTQNPFWTLAWRSPSSHAALEVPGDAFVSTVIESDLFEEGPFYLERRGSRLQGILDRTIVEGKFSDGGGIELLDAVTHLVVFRGRAESANIVTGTLFAENEQRIVRSAANVPEPFPEGAFTFSILRTSSRTVSGAKLRRHSSSVSGQVDGYGWLERAPFGRAVSGTFENDGLNLKVGSEKWSLRAGPGIFVGLVEPGHDVVVLRDPHKVEKVANTAPRTVDLGGGRSVVPRAVRNKSRFCEVSLMIPVITGANAAPELNRVLAEQMVGWAMGPLDPDDGSPIPAPEKFRCLPEYGSPSERYFMGADYEAVDLGGGWVNLRLKGYARTGGPRATVGQDCVLVDSAHAKLYRSGELLNEAQRVTLTSWVERRLRMMARNAQLNLDDDNYYANAAPISEKTSLCLTREGLEVAFNPGEITKYLPTAGPSVFIPRKLLARLVTEGSVLATLLKRP